MPLIQVFPHIFVTSPFDFVSFQFNFVWGFFLCSNSKFNFVTLSFILVNRQPNSNIRHCYSSNVLKFVSVAKRVRNGRINFVIMSHKFTTWSFKFVKPVTRLMDFYFFLCLFILKICFHALFCIYSLMFGKYTLMYGTHIGN